MAGTSGHGGSLTLSGLTVGVTGWNYEPDEEQLETTDLNSSGAREYVGGLKGFTVTANVNYSSTNTIKVGDSGTVTLATGEGTTISGSVRVATAPITLDVGGLITQVINLRGTGTLPL